jgi:hypothetical protein
MPFLTASTISGRIEACAYLHKQLDITQTRLTIPLGGGQEYTLRRREVDNGNSELAGEMNLVGRS